jgi:hypothetical protein
VYTACEAGKRGLASHTRARSPRRAEAEAESVASRVESSRGVT